MNANQAAISVSVACRTLGVSASGYYAWVKRAPSQRTLEDAVLTERIRAIHLTSDGNYGSPNIHAELRDEGTRIGRKRVARLMRHAGIRGVSRRRGFVVTTQRDPKQRPAPDLVNRRFVAEGPNELWVADMTYVPTWAGFIYLAIVLDVWSRRVVGWAIGEQMTSELVLAALNMAIAQRRTDQRHPSQRPRLPIHQRRLRPALPQDGRAAFDGQRRRRLRQRDGGELLRQPRMRTHRPTQLQNKSRSAHGPLHLHRRLVQPAATALGARARVAPQL